MSFQIELESLTEGDLVYADPYPFINANEFPTTYANADGDARLTFSCIQYRTDFQSAGLTVYHGVDCWLVSARLQITFLGEVNMGND